MLIILHCNPETYITDAQRRAITTMIQDNADPRFLIEPLRARVIDVELKATPLETVEGIPLTPGQWGQFAIIPYIPRGTSGGVELLRLINERRGYWWPVLVEANRLAELERVPGDEFDLGMVVG